MSKKQKYFLAMGKFGVLILSLLFLLIIGCSRGFVTGGKEIAPTPSPAPSPLSATLKPTNGLVQSSDEGSVTIEVKWVGLEKNQLVFEVTMNTHSVDLDQYDLGRLTVLRDDTGKEYHPTAWDSAPGGHHREGILTFSVPDSWRSGQAKYLQMIIRNVAGVKERVFRWEL